MPNDWQEQMPGGCQKWNNTIEYITILNGLSYSAEYYDCVPFLPVMPD